MSELRKTLFNRIDGTLLLLYITLVSIGIMAIFSVEHRATDPQIIMMNKGYMKQVMWLGYSLFIGLLIILTDSKFFSSFAFLIYTAGIFILIITIFAGVDVKGSRSWLGVGGFRFQPGEVAKIFTSLALARFFALNETNFRKLKDRLIAASIALGPAVLILLQKETGLALVYFSFFLVMFREGLPSAILITGFAAIALVITTLLLDRMTMAFVITGITILVGYAIRSNLRRRMSTRILLVSCWLFSILFSQFAVPFVFKNVLQKHQIERIYSMIGIDVPDEYNKALDPGDDRREHTNSSEYNVLQSKIAIGSGGMFGKGFLNGTSTKNQFVPEQNTDFIFCAIGEQFGFVGSATLIILYIMLMLRIIYLGERQRSDFTRVYAYCVACILFFHVAINISMTIGLAPVIGITLPFLSYGGSSLLSFSILIFILVRLDADRQVIIR